MQKKTVKIKKFFHRLKFSENLKNQILSPKVMCATMTVMTKNRKARA